MPASVIVDLPRSPRAPGQARGVVADLDGIAPQQLADARLLVSELVTNSVKYGGDGPVRLVVRSDDTGRLRIEVVDHGIGFVPAVRTPPSDAAGGWGLRLVEALADRWGVYRESAHVWFEMGAR